MFSSFMRRLTYCQVASPASGSTQSGPTQTNRCRRSLPIPKSATGWAGLSYFFPISADSNGTRLAALRPGGSMANQPNSPDNDTDTRGIADEEIRGGVDEEGDDFEDEDDLDEEEEEEEGGTL